ncbi:DNA repair protein for alkylated DNA [Gluconacetobacter johannae DSM 13595]|uniref:DNA oxidative demethylase AlkB n=1 Tax=Gluconacetobacter johannae TaxID=112140 RepID=A0A7W4P346_9PROT|nr:DNA oxidative demethylase AlkB [Gluconacetobacter johannae]MBB2175484.1 DNA oxidative demethylase AlkB [Gluconacetobacter johannae]GBQ89057.1 DNA repair protein for alkylated DNA [Gluconacetobacter johannae DSM 13595]
MPPDPAPPGPSFDLFTALRDQVLAPGAMLLGGFARDDALTLLAAIDDIVALAPFRRMTTPGGRAMSVAMTNCGQAGWVSDRAGYRYVPADPATGRPWPALPPSFAALAARAAARAGFAGFRPDACLVNRYDPGTRLTLHQDRNERDFSRPIVSVSLGLPALFLWGGPARTDRVRRVPLEHGDVVVWGGPARLTYHGIHTLADGTHPLTGRVRLNLTFRQAR